MTPALAFQFFTQANVDLSEFRFEPFHPGVEKARIFHDAASGQEVALIRYSPGSGVPRHKHQGYEHIFVLSGSQRDERGTYRAGTLIVNPPGSGHAVSSDEGCVILGFWQQPVVFE
jgi:anti-sigma factor ChrR (cupin superfamily)